MFPFKGNYSNTGVTVELGRLVDSGVNLWDFEYPSYYTGDDKTAFEQKVIDHYRFRQIGQETVGRFLHMFRSRIREIMPYYIDMYKTVELLHKQEDPLESYHLEETYDRTGSSSDRSESSSTGSKSGKNEGTRKFADTPQGKISNLDDHLTEATQEDATASESNTGKVNATSTGSNTEHYKMVRRGNIGVQPLGQELKILREAYINVDLMIIEELRDLFLLVY